jgi:hypothetical protein
MSSLNAGLFQKLFTQLQRPGLHFVAVAHDAHCPAAETQNASTCVCQPEITVQTEKQFVATVNQTRKELRKAKRVSENVLRKAKGGQS